MYRIRVHIFKWLIHTLIQKFMLIGVITSYRLAYITPQVLIQDYRGIYLQSKTEDQKSLN